MEGSYQLVAVCGSELEDLKSSDIVNMHSVGLGRKDSSPREKLI